MGDVTLCLLLHANGLNRRVWAPLAEDLAALRGRPLEELTPPRAEASLMRIGSLWLASLDLLGHGAAPELQLAGAETDWMQFRDQVEAFLAEYLALLPEVPKEVVAVGHSLGGGVLLTTQAFAERQRFSRMLIFEPMWLFVEPPLWKLINLPPLPPETTKLEPPVVAQTLRRRSEWPSRAAAHADLSKKGFFASWDPRVFEAQLLRSVFLFSVAHF
ncbi:ddx27 [Symbiodinium necroappetens]|uniref:Ddx27 protein n=1 Tax=Symbiodinium necroappetens TaxID=1628268 RepID=A0A813C0S8_9DINO|nr:ddx27 [Symbiodinium necroappetens]